MVFESATEGSKEGEREREIGMERVKTTASDMEFIFSPFRFAPFISFQCIDV